MTNKQLRKKRPVLNTGRKNKYVAAKGLEQKNRMLLNAYSQDYRHTVCSMGLA
jgi:hypothetical protein